MEAPLPVLETAQALRDQGRFQAAADILAAAFRDQPKNGEVCLQLALVLNAAGDRETAIEFLRRGHQCSPSNPQISAELALLLREAGRIEEAAQALLESLEARNEPIHFNGFLLDATIDPAA